MHSDSKGVPTTQELPNSADPTGSHPPYPEKLWDGSMAGRYWKALPSGLPWWHVSSLPSLVGDCCSGRRLDRKLQIGGSASCWAGYHCSSTWGLLSRPFEKSRSETPHAFSILQPLPRNQPRIHHLAVRVSQVCDVWHSRWPRDPHFGHSAGDSFWEDFHGFQDVSVFQPWKFPSTELLSRTQVIYIYTYNIYNII